MPIPTPSGLVFTAPFVNSQNKVAIISSGARGQGATEAGLFAQEGAKVVLGDVLDEDGKTVERGTHNALLRDGGTYASLWARQQKTLDLEAAD